MSENGNQKKLTLRLRREYHDRIERLRMPKEGKAGCLINLIMPILNGQFSPVRDDEGRVVDYKRNQKRRFKPLPQLPGRGRPEKEPSQN